MPQPRMSCLRPIPESVKAILNRHGKTSTFPSPVRISEDLFFDLYRQGALTEGKSDAPVVSSSDLR